MINEYKCLVCNCNITKSNQGITRHNFIKYGGYDAQETICLKCYNKGWDFDNLKGGLKNDN